MKANLVYRIIQRFEDKYRVSKMCAFYRVSRSGYYNWRKNCAAEPKDRRLVELINECHAAHKRRYGYRRVKLWLEREKGLKINHKRILRVMNKYNLLSVIRRKSIYKFKQNGNLVYANILNRNFRVDEPNCKWVTDISYIITPEGVMFLSAIRDLFDNYVVAYKMATRQEYALVSETIRSALSCEKPKRKIILHSDGGGQYRSFGYHNETIESGITPSMSKPASPGDNALAENFFSIFKTECIHMEKPKTIAQARLLTEEFINYYNYNRLQLIGKTPFETRREWFDTHPE